MATTGAKTGATGPKSKTILRILWRSLFECLTKEELAESEVASKVTIGALAGVRANIAAGAGVQQLLPLVGVPPASSFLSLKGGFW